MGPLMMCQMYMTTHNLYQKLVLGLLCHSVWLFDLCNPTNALSELAKFLSQGSDFAKFWALGPTTPVIGCVFATPPMSKISFGSYVSFCVVI